MKVKTILFRIVTSFTCLLFIILLTTSTYSSRYVESDNSSTNMIVTFNHITNYPIVVSGVLDRIENRQIAVILLEDIDEQITIPKTKLPKGSTTNTWFMIKIYRSFITLLAIDENRTMVEKQKSEQLREKLRKKLDK